MMNIIVGALFVILGAIFTLWPRSLWWWRWGWLHDREPSRLNLVLSSVSGALMVVIGLILIIEGVN